MKKKRITVGYTNRKSSSEWTTVPKIQMEGLWLEELGYNVGDKIILEYDASDLHIRPMTTAEKIELKQKELDTEVKRRQKELKKIQDDAADKIAQLAKVAEEGGHYSTASSYT